MVPSGMVLLKTLPDRWRFSVYTCTGFRGVARSRSDARPDFRSVRAKRSPGGGSREGGAQRQGRRYSRNVDGNSYILIHIQY
eukprot:9414639-Pyramimonas_sp.AAC.1